MGFARVDTEDCCWFFLYSQVHLLSTASGDEIPQKTKGKFEAENRSLGEHSSGGGISGVIILATVQPMIHTSCVIRRSQVSLPMLLHIAGEIRVKYF
jgi:hypothetical protein